MSSSGLDVAGAQKRPVIFLDVDGAITTVIDPINDFSDPDVLWARHDGLGVRYNPKVPGWIQELTRLAEIRWTTSWHERARTQLAPALGLPDFDVVDERAYRGAGLDYKYAAVLEQLTSADGRPVIWIDDELAYNNEYEHLHALAGTEGRGRFFAVRTSMEDGLTEAHVKRIRAFICQVGWAA